MDNLNKLLFDVCRNKEPLEKVLPYINQGLIDINQGNTDNNASTPLMVAILENNIEMVKFLASHKDIEIDKKDNYSRTALVLACSKGTIECVRYLLTSEDVSPKPNLYYDKNIIPIRYALSFKNEDVLRYLIIEYNLEIGEDTREFLKTNKTREKLAQEMLELIRVRELSNNLENDLIDKEISLKKRKI